MIIPLSVPLSSQDVDSKMMSECDKYLSHLKGW
jgi:hypothetical protein